MTDESTLVYFLLGLLQVIIIGLNSWLLLTMVKVVQRLAAMETKFDAFPIQQINNNRHRIEQLERHQELVDHRMGVIEGTLEAIKRFCGANHNTNL